MALGVLRHASSSSTSFPKFYNSERKLTSLSTVYSLLTMGDMKQLKKELKNLTKEFKWLRLKMEDISDHDTSPNNEDVQHLSDTMYLQWLLNNYGELSDEIR